MKTDLSYLVVPYQPVRWVLLIYFGLIINYSHFAAIVYVILPVELCVADTVSEFRGTAFLRQQRLGAFWRNGFAVPSCFFVVSPHHMKRQ